MENGERRREVIREIKAEVGLLRREVERMYGELNGLVALWKRQAKVDCDPANGNEFVQCSGRAVGRCAKELEAVLRGKKG